VSVCPGAHPIVTASCEPFERNDPLGGLSLVPCAAQGGLGPHKWRDRSWLDERADPLGDGIVLLVDGDDVLEASRSNLFAVVGQTVWTPPTDGRILPGLARRLVIDLLRRAGVDVREEPITLDSLAAASEVFVTNSLREVEWVGTCEGVGTWPAGPVTALARRLVDEDRAADLEPAARADEITLSNRVG
jgi:para-aminobenzoate synthetase/4-amino-4-deoxychorismate lyase